MFINKIMKIIIGNNKIDIVCKIIKKLSDGMTPNIIGIATKMKNKLPDGMIIDIHFVAI